MLLHQSMGDSKDLVQGSLRRQWCWVWHCAIVLLCMLPFVADSKAAVACDGESLHIFQEAIHKHSSDWLRKDSKFTDIWYYHGPISEKHTRYVTFEDIKGYLRRLGDRKSALLFHWFDSDQLRTWLLTSDGPMVCARPRTLTLDDWKTLDANNWSVLGARGARQARAKAVFADDPRQDNETQDLQWDALLERLSNILLPTEVVVELKSSNIDTLVVVPITVIGPSAPPHFGGSPRIWMWRTLSLSTVPFAALPFENGKLIDKFSIVISPGFHSFGNDPNGARRQLRHPVVLGNPASSSYPNLPGAEDEAKHVATRLGTRVLIREAATKKALKKYLNQHSASVDLIHLATHGVADAKNPLDGSELVFSDGSWIARDIGALKLTGKPLVVMSACQTALGKNFPSGTIGLAQAWHRAGASNVVMSLWSVDDMATKELMGQFVDLVASGQAVDKALQAAMVSLRDKYPNPAHWASFSIYGAPERIGETASP